MSVTAKFFARIRIVDECERVWIRGGIGCLVLLFAAGIAAALFEKYRIAAALGSLAGVSAGIAIGASIVERKFTK